jgi:aspartyl-tRNA(Asn)/glutamyl-tRNA(Gln) amidotransferase subunit C
MVKKKLTKEEVSHLAKLSQLYLKPDEIEKITKQLEETISFVNNLNELDTKSVLPTSQTVNLKNIFFLDNAKNQRGLNHNEVFSNSKNVKKNCFSVKKIF